MSQSQVTVAVGGTLIGLFSVAFQTPNDNRTPGTSVPGFVGLKSVCGKDGDMHYLVRGVAILPTTIPIIPTKFS